MNLNNFDNNISDKTYLYWYEKFGTHKSKEMIQKRVQKNTIILLMIFVVGCFILWHHNYQKNETLNNYGINTKAVVSKIKRHFYNDVFYGPVDNYHITYDFVINGIEVTKTQEILKENYELYFDKNIRIGDSIEIKYNPNKPINSRIEKLK